MTTNKELRELAEKAASGVWYEPGDLLCHDNRSGETHGLHHDDDGYLAAASPATVLALLDAYEALQAECEKLRKEAATEREIQRAAEVLPEGWMIRVDIEKNAGWVDLYRPGGGRVAFDFQGTLAEQIEEAIDSAMKGSAAA